ncbi:hypothetical protein QOZ80_1AG0019980 [Eleusine coracana subsp. coracana]|nr:hypothetical protein QOZ80_1AG0019980 [Eleusine coracana subsp. coracana]
MVPAEDNSTTPNKTKVALVVCIVLSAIVVAAAITIPFLVIDPQDAIKFHVMATEVSGLDSASSPMIHPSFDLAVRVENHAMFRECWENVTITVFYGNTVVGWGTLPHFCVGKWTSVEVKATMSHTDVVLTDTLRGHMASQISTGELQFDVEMRMLLSQGYIWTANAKTVCRDRASSFAR